MPLGLQAPWRTWSIILSFGVAASCVVPQAHAQAGRRLTTAAKARIARDAAAIDDICSNWSGPHGPAPRPHRAIEKAISRSEAVWLVRSSAATPWWGHAGLAVSFIGAFYGIERARNLNHLASMCLYFGARKSPWAVGNPALRWQPDTWDLPFLASAAENYLIDLYWWRHDTVALAAAFRYMWTGGPSEGRLGDIAVCWLYGRPDLLACAATDGGVAAVLEDGFYSGGPNNEEPELPAPRRTLAILRRIGGQRSAAGRGARRVASLLASELRKYGNPP